MDTLIAVGGSGAQVARAVLHLCAAGLGPSKLGLVLVDQDAAAGGGDVTAETVQAYLAMQHLFGLQGTDKLERAELLPFASELKYVGRLQPAVATAGDTLQTMAMAPGAPGVADLLTCLFHGAKEASQPLNIGYLGHPNVGAAVRRMSAMAAEAAMPALAAQLAATEADGGRVFIVGSIVGGTGAAGLPTLGQEARDFLGADEPGKAKIGCAMMLPYFEFPPAPAGAVGLPAGAVMSHARLALPFYPDLIPGVFSRAYLIGTDPLINLGYYEAGGSRQRNPASFPELLGAAAAAHFFANPAPLDGGPVHWTARRQAASFTWSDIPDVSAPQDVQRALGQLLRWAVAWRQGYSPALAQDTYRSYAKETWYRLHLGTGRSPLAAWFHSKVAPVDPSDVAFQQKRQQVDAYVALLLAWWAQIDFMQTGAPVAGAAKPLPLVDSDVFATVGATHPIQATLRPTPDSDKFGRMVFGVDGKTHAASDLSDIFWQLSEGPRQRNAVGLGRLIGALYAASRL